MANEDEILVLSSFRKFDVAGNGTMRRCDMVQALCCLGISTLHASKLVDAFGSTKSDHTPYVEFLTWVFSVAEDSSLIADGSKTVDPVEPRRCELSSFEKLLTMGGDDRSCIDPATGTNKYHCIPRPISEGMIFRGSCTCNPPTQSGYDAALRLFNAKFSGANEEETKTSVKMVMANIRKRISVALDLPQGAEVIICPSGSDAEYIPVAIARALFNDGQADRHIMNVITQLNEIGAGSSPAGGGRFFSTRTPLAGELPTGHGQGHLMGMEAKNLSCVCIPARQRDGSVTHVAEALEAARTEAVANGVYPIVHGVFGGKTGLVDARLPTSLGDDVASEALAVIDGCQGRFTLQELHSWLAPGHDALVLFTGSKFFQGPPFCAAVIIPPSIASKLRERPAPGPSSMYDSALGLGAFVSPAEFPESLPRWREQLTDRSNVGLALRWEASLANMEQLSDLKDVVRSRAVEEWSRACEALVKSEEWLDAWCVHGSILSIRLSKNSQRTEWRGMAELKNVYRWMTLDLSATMAELKNVYRWMSLEREMPEDAAAVAPRCFIGQPVDVADSHAIVRIAFDVDALAKYCKVSKDLVLLDDTALVRKLATLARNYDALLACGV